MTERSPTDLHAEERDAKKAARDAELAKQTEEDDIKWLMGHKQGRRIMYRLLAAAGVFRSSFNTNNAVMSFNEGQRNLGIAHQDAVLAHCPEQYMVMLREHKPK
jgi:hypothetical protein